MVTASPRCWAKTNVGRDNITHAHQDADDATDAPPTNIADNYDGSDDDQTIMEYRAFYGPGELETFRHTQLQQKVKDAKLKVWYPGRWHRHSPHAYLRTRLADAYNIHELWKEEGVDADGLVLLKFRSNARIISAKLDFSDYNHNVGIDGQKKDDALPHKKQCQLHWQSEMQTISNETVYDHDILLVHNNGNDDGDIDVAKSGSSLVLELDTRVLPTSEDLDAAKDYMSKVETGERGEDDAGLNGKVGSRAELIHAPPCITLVPSSSAIINNKRYQHQEWEWRNVGDEEWIPISSCWVSNIYEINEQQHQIHSQPSVLPSNIEESIVDALWRFPHQIDLCKVSNVIPMKQLSYVDCANDASNKIANGSTHDDELIYDFGRELLGKVHVSVPATSTSTQTPIGLHPRSVKLRVGESLVEAMNDEEDHFEQCVDLCYSLEHESTNSDGEAQRTKAEPSSHVWVSFHLLAFRYVRIIISNDSDVTVSCQSHLPLIHQRGSFSCSSNTDASETNMCELDVKIWQSAAYTLQLCMHDNFIVDGTHYHNHIIVLHHLISRFWLVFHTSLFYRHQT